MFSMPASFIWPSRRGDRHAGSVGRELVQQTVLRTAADDMQPLDRERSQRAELVEHVLVLESQTLENAADQLRMIARHFLPSGGDSFDF